MVLLTGTKETVIKATRKHLIHEVSEEKNFKVSDGQEGYIVKCHFSLDSFF